MGDRLVVSIRHNGEFFAGAYLHWAASDEDKFDEILTKYLEEEACFHDEDTVRTKALAVSCLQKAINEYNKNEEAGIVTHWVISNTPDRQKLYVSEESEKFLQENTFIKEGKNHNAYITVDEHIWFDWEGWAEGIIDCDYDERELSVLREEWKKNRDSLYEWQEEYLK